ncbi:peptide deformylase [Buchnera aphidicola]|uniref:peptide deformylase n=1 Tax=Buchnera aphidicola TaxID=9 RepID=UPI003463DE6F
MGLLKILQHPDKRLRKKAKPVKKIDKKIQKIIHDMLETMYKKKGIGLAATQVNIHLQIIVIDITKDKKKPIILINPKKTYEYGIIQIEESCLSISNVTKNINRSHIIKIEALNYYGQKTKISAKDLLSICIQHEMDHLQGKLLIDY